MTRRIVILSLLITLLLTASCNSIFPKNQEKLSPEPGKGAMQGKLNPVPAMWSGVTVYSFAAPYMGRPDGNGIFILDESLHPKGEVDDQGNFQINNIPPGDYVLVFGPNSEEGIAYREEGNAPLFKVEADQILDVGTVSISP